MTPMLDGCGVSVGWSVDVVEGTAVASVGDFVNSDVRGGGIQGVCADGKVAGVCGAAVCIGKTG